MGAYTGSFIRRPTANSADSICAAHNAVTDAIVGSGMTLLSSTYAANPVGTFVSGTASAGQTTFTLPSTNTSTPYSQGFNYFKHPMLQMVVRVQYHTFYAGATSNQLCTLYTFSVASSMLLDLTWPADSASSSSDLTSVTGTSYFLVMLGAGTVLSLRAYCGSEGFWISGQGDIIDYSTTAGGVLHITSYRRGGPSFACFAAAEDPGILMALYPHTMYNYSSGYPAHLDMSNMAPIGHQIWTRSNLWAARPKSPFSLEDPTTVSGIYGVRAKQVLYPVDGKTYTFPVAIVPGSIASSSFTSVNIDLGGGLRAYGCPEAFGPVGPIWRGMARTDMASFAFPWA